MGRALEISWELELVGCCRKLRSRGGSGVLDQGLLCLALTWGGMRICDPVVGQDNETQIYKGLCELSSWGLDNAAPVKGAGQAPDGQGRPLLTPGLSISSY